MQMQQKSVERMSPQRTPERQTAVDIKIALNQKLLELRAESPRKVSQNTIEEGEENDGLSQIIDFDEIGSLPVVNQSEN